MFKYTDEQVIKSKWEDIVRQWFKYSSSIEDKEPVKKLIEQYQSIEQDDDGANCYVCDIYS